MVEFTKIDKKWQSKWEKARIFEPEIDKKEKFFVTFPYPYINLSPHIGHFYTLMRVEAFARYKRARGYNVLFPQAWHCTGSPIVAAADRVKEKEVGIIESLRKEGFSEEEIREFEDPEHWIRVFSKIWLRDLKAMGLSVDWRRNFITTSLNQYYDNFVKWQFRKLREKGYIEKGKHAVVWDPKTNMPVGDHDRIKGEGEVPQEVILVKHKLDDERFLVSGTIRPETILGVTNLYVHPDFDYREIEIDNEKWILGDVAVNRLEEQGFKLKRRGFIKGINFIGKKTEEFNGRKVLVLPATFLKSDRGTGLVHSVPSDSADDLIALWDLQKDENLVKRYKLDINEVKGIKPVPILNTPELGDVAAKTILEKYKVKSQNEREKLDAIRKELYTISFYSATFNEKYSKVFSKNLLGKRVSEGKDIIRSDLIRQGWAISYYELTGEVISRSLSKCIVKIVEDQWFITYGDKNWKRDVHKALRDVKLYPEDVREQFEYVIDWLNDWACTREYGLGSRLPFDNKWLIESLSDSTIYMAYYTIAHLIKELSLKEIDDNFFDYVFLGGGKGRNKWNKLRKEFGYWYPLDFRNSGKDLIQNHLAFFLFNHVAIFPKKYWPRAIGVNGWVRVEGEKMSKSLGNIVPLKEMSEKFGADASRLTILNGGEGLDDPNWDSRFAEGLGKRFEGFVNIIGYYGKGVSKRRKIDDWMKNRLAVYVEKATRFMEETLFRSAIQRIYFDFISDIRWYLRRVERPNKRVMKGVIEAFIIMMQPFTPHLAEELWHKIGKKSFVSLEKWPSFKVEKFEDTEILIRKLIEDVNSLLRLIKKKSSKIFIYVIPKEVATYKEATDFLTKELKLEIEIYATNDKKIYDPTNKSRRAKTGRPALYIE